MSKTEQLESAASLALAARDVARLLGISERHLWSLNASGNCPRPIRMGRSVRWRRDELKAWVAAGCPSRENWEAMEAHS